ncbi:MAG: hypothetical protein H7318_04710 [Oligoflexus sp.]|nr:hypothetical protein [Oligoflexus sp.]
MESKYAEQTSELGQIATNSLLKVRDFASTPIIYITRFDQTHADKNINRSHDFAFGQQRGDCTLYARKKKGHCESCQQLEAIGV